MKLAWLTDIHLNFLRDERAKIQELCAKVLEAAPDAVVISGDIGEAPIVERYLRTLQEGIRKPIYFVLGNHDFYAGSVAGVRDRMRALTEKTNHLRWLPAMGVVPLTAATALVGHDSWADGRYGKGAASTLKMSDKDHINDFVSLAKEAYFERIAALADEAAAHVRQMLMKAFESHARVLLVTHVPPFPQACRADEGVAREEMLPHYSCKAMGDLLLDVMGSRPDRDVTVLCGHTHVEARAEILPNLRVWTGGAHYGAIRIQTAVDVA